MENKGRGPMVSLRKQKMVRRKKISRQTQKNLLLSGYYAYICRLRGAYSPSAQTTEST